MTPPTQLDLLQSKTNLVGVVMTTPYRINCDQITETFLKNPYNNITN